MQSTSTTASGSFSTASSKQSNVATQHGLQLPNVLDPEPVEVADREVPNASDLHGNSGGSPTSPSSRLKLDRIDAHDPEDEFQDGTSDDADEFVSSSLEDHRSFSDFYVAKKKSGTNGLKLDQFPNEVLTHVLSHLPAPSLSAMACVSRRFYSLVTTPHAWRIAFSRYFPGRDALDGGLVTRSNAQQDQNGRDQLRAEQRWFTRLSIDASWRTEYILRTRLLRSLVRGRPSQSTTSHGSSSRSHNNSTSPVITYNSQLYSTINHIHATWNNGKKAPRFIHGTDETGSACISDPTTGKVDNWGLSDPQSLPQFADLFPGDQPYGLGEGHTIGAPNIMDVSQPFGMIYGEGFPGGLAYFRSPEEKRGRFLSSSTTHSDETLGIPKVPELTESISSVWIAKSPSVPTATAGLVGVITGTSCGIVSTYSLGADNLRDSRLAKGEITGRWMLSPGVPIISVIADDHYSDNRKASKRIWAVALNALGEVFYLVDIPRRIPIERGTHLDEVSLLTLAWETGRSAAWILLESTRRLARSDPYQTLDFDGSYSPRSSSREMNLSSAQLIAETREIEKFLSFKPKDFRKMCDGWEMRRILEVDFAGDDDKGAGENIVVIDRGFSEDQPAQLKRYTRIKSEQASLADYPVPKTPPMAPQKPTMASLFGGGPSTPAPHRSPTTPLRQSPSPAPSAGQATRLVEEWRTSNFSWGKLQNIEITASAIDMSTTALMTADEDPLIHGNDGDNVPSPSSTTDQESKDSSKVPGYRARILAIGTSTGSVIAWNMRGPHSENSAITNTLQPLRIIYTDSPQISCLALSALYIVHGGNDGLVQAWDPLASTLQPLRTLNSRFSSRARRRLVQAEASPQGVGINLFAAGAIVIDPDPTTLRGMVSLGTHLRFWSYSSNASDQISSKKRRLRRSSERGSNAGTDRFSSSGRGAIMDYILSEQEEVKKEKHRKAKEESRLRGRFGVGLNGFSDEEAIRYAEMLSHESYQQDEERRVSDSGYSPDLSAASSSAQSPGSSDTVTPEGSVAMTASPKYKTDEELDHDIEEAIRLSMLDEADKSHSGLPSANSSSYGIPFTVKHKKPKSKRSSPSSSPMSLPSGLAPQSISTDGDIAVDDLDLALKLSLAEEQSRREAETAKEEYPVLETRVIGKGKGRAV